MITLITICLTFIGSLLTLHGGPRHTKISTTGVIIMLIALVGWVYLFGYFCAWVVEMMVRYLP